ncbi:MAG: response regulator transcription factor [Bacteroidota bacterium]|nr:response regulator transcription factor [Bacteroidota bacterium]
MTKIKVLIADDHQVVRRGISTLLEDENDIEIIGEASDGLETLEKVKNHMPDIVLLDISMPKLTGIETAGLITKKFKTVKTLIFSMHHNEDYIIKSVESGASGYILKDTTKEEILQAIRKIHAGEKYFTHQVSNIIIETLASKPKKNGLKKDTYNISKKELVVLKQIVNGKNSREIAEILNLSIRTVDNHRARIMKKTAVKNAVELVKLALKDNLV